MYKPIFFAISGDKSKLKILFSFILYNDNMFLIDEANINIILSTSLFLYSWMYFSSFPESSQDSFLHCIYITSAFSMVFKPRFFIYFFIFTFAFLLQSASCVCRHNNNLTIFISGRSNKTYGSHSPHIIPFQFPFSRTIL